MITENERVVIPSAAVITTGIVVVVPLIATADDAIREVAGKPLMVMVAPASARKMMTRTLWVLLEIVDVKFPLATSLTTG